MIDTIVLMLKQNEFEVLDWSKFKREVVSGKNPYTKYTLIKNVKTEGYKPQLTIYDRFGWTARIQFSAPKVLYNGNNFNEVVDNDFETLIRKLSFLLGTIYIAVTPHQLRITEVSKIDYAKNIIFTDRTTSSMILGELNKIDISAKLDHDDRDYKNGGQRLSYHANSWEICFYDKRKELEQYTKYGTKRTDEDGSIQPELIERILLDPLEVFRIEYRLNTKNKIREIFSKYNINADLKLESVFKKDISQKLLTGIWQVFEDKFDYTLHNSDDPIALLEGVFKAKTDISLLNALAAAMSFYIASSGDGGMKRFREIVEKYSDLRSWQRIKKKQRAVGLLPNKTKLEALLQIGKQLEQFEPTKLVDYPQLQNLRCKQM